MLVETSNSYSLPTTRYSLLLLSYFRSGWVFLIPYLAAYLLFAWLHWPVNPTTAGSREQGAGSGVPCLLHVYWFLHGLHLILGILALRAWWRGSGATVTGATDDGRSAIDHATLSQPSAVQVSSNRSLDTFYCLLPWVFLGLLFYLPGIYLEWPSDPWEHLRRINEWHILDEVTAHSAWKKSSYFMPYSLLCWSMGLRQLFWLNFYYTGCCMLLCWQYFRLARIVGLGERASFVFALLQALTLGNNIFGFYRYYGMSSTLFAQLGAVALIRVALETLRPKGAGDLTRKPEFGSQPYFLRPFISVLWRPLGAILLLVALTALNHVQGIGVAALGVAAVVVWRLVEWRRSLVWWLPVAGVISACAAYAWLPRHPLLDKVYQPAGWLNCWYGFNLLWLGSPAFERAYLILGGFGMFNLTLALVLAVRGQVAGWMAVVPMLALLHPVVAIPVSNFLAIGGADNIMVFHRLLFSIPTALPLIVFLAGYAEGTSASCADDGNKDAYGRFRSLAIVGFAKHGVWGIVTAGLLYLIVTSHGRLWHILYQVPDDLAMRPVLEATHQFVTTKPTSKQYFLLGSASMDFIYGTQDSQLSPFSPYAPPRIYWYPIARAPTDDVWVIERYLITQSKQRPLLILAPNPTVPSTTNSIAASLSNHWLPQETALAFAGAAQIRSVAEYHGLSIAARHPAILFLTNGSLVTKSAEAR